MTTRTYRQTRRADTTERTRAAMLVAARDLFREDPQFDPSLEALAERAGVSTRTVIRQFGSKEGVLEQAGIDLRGVLLTVKRRRVDTKGERSFALVGARPAAVCLLHRVTLITPAEIGVHRRVSNSPAFHCR